MIKKISVILICVILLSCDFNDEPECNVDNVNESWTYQSIDYLMMDRTEYCHCDGIWYDYRETKFDENGDCLNRQQNKPL